MVRALRSGASSQPSKRPADNNDNMEQRKKQKQDQPAADTGIAKAKQVEKSKKTSQPGIVIRENQGERPSKQKKSSKKGKETEKRKGKQPVVHESGSEPESDHEDEEQVDMSEEDDGEPIEEQEWVGTFVSAKARRAYDKIVTSKAYIPKSHCTFQLLVESIPHSC